MFALHLAVSFTLRLELAYSFNMVTLYLPEWRKPLLHFSHLAGKAYQIRKIAAEAK